MTLRLHPDLIAAGYDFLRQSQPFNTWGLPESDEVGFVICRKPDRYAEFNVIDGVPTIHVSEVCVGQTGTLLAKLSHELCHFRQHIIGAKDNHGASFKRLAKQVCRFHGFDLKSF